MNHKLLFPTYRKRYLFVRDVLRGLTRDGVVGRMLDLGSGEGDLDPLLASHAERLDACDVNAGDVERARMLNADLPHVCYRVEDAAALSYEDGVFDLVVCLEVIEHVNDPMGLLREARRVLRPGGHLVLTCPSRDFPVTYDPINRVLQRRSRPLPIGAYGYGHTWLVDAGELRGWLEGLGFHIEVQDRLSHGLAGMVECYVPGLVQKALKANAANRAGDHRGVALTPSRGEPPLVALTDALIRLDDRWLGRSRRSVGLGYVARKMEP